MEKPKQRYEGVLWMAAIITTNALVWTTTNPWILIPAVLFSGGAIGWVSTFVDKYKHLCALIEYEHQKHWRGGE